MSKAMPFEVKGWAIVGTGFFADGYAAPALRMARDVKLVAVHSRDRERGLAFAKKHGIPRSYDSYSQMLADPEIKVVHITTPNHLHTEQTIAAASAGKHVLCEKPMALTIEDCQRMIEACKKGKVKLGIGFQNRHHPAHVESRRLIKNGLLGEIALATASYSHSWTDRSLTGWRADPIMAGGGSLMGMGLHCLDLLRFLLGKEVEEVSALSDAKYISRPVEETIIITLKLKNGPFGSVIAGFHVPWAYNNVVIHGTKARITGVDTVGMPLKGHLEIIGENINERKDYQYPDPSIGKYVYQAEALNRSIDEDTEPDASGLDGLEATRLMVAIEKSARLEQAIKIR